MAEDDFNFTTIGLPDRLAVGQVPDIQSIITGTSSWWRRLSGETVLERLRGMDIRFNSEVTLNGTAIRISDEILARTYERELQRTASHAAAVLAVLNAGRSPDRRFTADIPPVTTAVRPDAGYRGILGPRPPYSGVWNESGSFNMNRLIDYARGETGTTPANGAAVLANLERRSIFFEPPTGMDPETYRSQLIEAYNRAATTGPRRATFEEALGVMVDYHLALHPGAAVTLGPQSLSPTAGTGTPHTNEYGITVPGNFAHLFRRPSSERTSPLENPEGRLAAAQALASRVAATGEGAQNPGLEVMDNFLRAGVTFSRYDPTSFASVYNNALGRPGGNHQTAVGEVLQFQMALHHARAVVEQDGAARARRLTEQEGPRRRFVGDDGRLDFGRLATNLRSGWGLHDELRDLDRLGMRFNQAGQHAYLQARLQTQDGETPAQAMERALRAGDGASGNLLANQGLISPSSPTRTLPVARADIGSGEIDTEHLEPAEVRPQSTLSQPVAPVLRRLPEVAQRPDATAGQEIFQPNPRAHTVHARLAGILSGIPVHQRGAFSHAISALLNGGAAPGRDPTRNGQVWDVLMGALGNDAAAARATAANIIRASLRDWRRSSDDEILTELRTGGLGPLTQALARSPQVTAALQGFQTALGHPNRGLTFGNDILEAAGTAHQSGTFAPQIRAPVQRSGVDDGQTATVQLAANTSTAAPRPLA